MTTEDWRRLREAFDAVYSLDPSARAEVIRRRCGDSPELVAELESLLAHADAAKADRFLEPTSFDFADDGSNESEEESIPAGARFGPYAVERLLGWGGMGDVYLARRIEDYDQLVAIKRIRGAMSAESLRRFHVERQLLAQLAHPSIVRLLDGGSTNAGEPYLVMEYVDGVVLDEYCRTENLDFANRARLVHVVAEAVAHAHEQGVVHRDLKPRNILVTASGAPQGQRALIGRFGGV